MWIVRWKIIVESKKQFLLTNCIMNIELYTNCIIILFLILRMIEKTKELAKLLNRSNYINNCV